MLPKRSLHCVKLRFNLNGHAYPLGCVCSVGAEEKIELVNVRVNFRQFS